MQLAGPGVFGPPKDPEGAVAILREAVAAGVNHIDTSDFYGPHLTNQIIRQALHLYPAGLVIVTKLGARRPPDGSWQSAISPQDLNAAVHDNLRNLGIDALDIVNYRAMGAIHGPAEGSIAKEVTVLVDLHRQGLIRHIGLSNVTATQVAEAQAITDVVCVQNNYNLAHRHDDALIDDLARQGIVYVPFFPLGGFTPLQSSTLSAVAGRRGPSRSLADAGRAGLAAAPVAQHLVDPRHVFGRPPTGEPGRRSVDAVAADLGRIGRNCRRNSDGKALKRLRHLPISPPLQTVTTTATAGESTRAVIPLHQ
jgi:aryl-alcohol dehydrogenase-like predicted oxidoreductase